MALFKLYYLYLLYSIYLVCYNMDVIIQLVRYDIPKVLKYYWKIYMGEL